MKHTYTMPKVIKIGYAPTAKATAFVQGVCAKISLQR